MPTTKPRFQVTETEEVARALELAAAEWPESSRSERVLRLFQEAASALEARHSDALRRRLGAIDFSAGSLDVIYEPGYLDDLRREWSE